MGPTSPHENIRCAKDAGVGVVFLHVQQLPDLGRGDSKGSSCCQVRGERSLQGGTTCLPAAPVSYLGVQDCALSFNSIGSTKRFQLCLCLPFNLPAPPPSPLAPELFKAMSSKQEPLSLNREEGVAGNCRISAGSAGFELSFSCLQGSLLAHPRHFVLVRSHQRWSFNHGPQVHSTFFCCLAMNKCPLFSPVLCHPQFYVNPISVFMLLVGDFTVKNTLQ